MRRAIRFYADEHISKAIVQGLRQRGVEVLTVVEAGMLGATDEEHLSFANSDGWTVITQDDDFLRLHAGGAKHRGIVFVRQGLRVGEIVRGLMLIHGLLSAEDMARHVEFL